MPDATYTRDDEIHKRQVKKFKEKDFAQIGKLNYLCQTHEGEPIKYFCRDDNEPLCGECVILHSKHDFVKADYKAASSIRLQLNQSIDNIDNQLKNYKQVLDTTNTKLKDMDIDSKRQFARVADVFREVREIIFQREKKIKETLHAKIREAQQSLKEDVHTVTKIMDELIRIKATGSELKRSFDDETDNCAGIVGSVQSVNQLHKVFQQYSEDVLSCHELESFVVKKELSQHPAVPEFNYNAAECRLFIEELGAINQPHDFPTNEHGGQIGTPLNYAG